MRLNLTRRELLGQLVALAAAGGLGSAVAGAEGFRLSTFRADVTPPQGHPLLCGMYADVTEVIDPLVACGFVLLGADKPIVLVSIDWCEIRNDAHDRWRDVLAEAAGTDRLHVLVHSVHQHDAPVADLEAERILQAHGVKGRFIDLDFHEQCVQRTAAALKEGLAKAQPVTHLGLGTAVVDKVASNRRVDLPDGTYNFNRSSSTTKLYGQYPEGLVDPVLRTLSFWNWERPIAAVHAYATHPQSSFGKGLVTSDFPGIARERRQADDEAVFQIYVSGASGNVTAGKYNDGTPENRTLLADRVYQGMVAGWKATKRVPLERIAFRSVPLRLEPRDDPEFSVEALTKTVSNAELEYKKRGLAAMALSWRKREDAGYKLDVPAIDFGPAVLMLLPAEVYVEYQLFAQKARPDAFVMTLGYGECAPGYIPTEQHYEWNDGNLVLWRWIAPGAEPRMQAAIKAALGAK